MKDVRTAWIEDAEARKDRPCIRLPKAEFPKPQDEIWDGIWTFGRTWFMEGVICLPS